MMFIFLCMLFECVACLKHAWYVLVWLSIRLGQSMQDVDLRDG